MLVSQFVGGGDIVAGAITEAIKQEADDDARTRRNVEAPAANQQLLGGAFLTSRHRRSGSRAGAVPSSRGPA